MGNAAASGIYHNQESSSSRKNIIRPKAGAKRRRTNQNQVK